MIKILKNIGITAALSVLLCTFAPISSAVSVDEVLERPGTNENYPELEQVANLPEVSIESGVAIFINTVLRFAFLLCLTTIVIISINLVRSDGDEDKMTQAKKMIIFLLIGMAIIAGSMAIITGVSRFNFFDDEFDEETPAEETNTTENEGN